MAEIYITTITTQYLTDGAGGTLVNTSSVVLYFTEVTHATGGQSQGATAGEIVGGIFLLILIAACWGGSKC